MPTPFNLNSKKLLLPSTLISYTKAVPPRTGTIGVPNDIDKLHIVDIGFKVPAIIGLIEYLKPNFVR